LKYKFKSPYRFTSQTTIWLKNNNDIDKVLSHCYLTDGQIDWNSDYHRAPHLLCGSLKIMCIKTIMYTKTLEYGITMSLILDLDKQAIISICLWVWQHKFVTTKSWNCKRRYFYGYYIWRICERPDIYVYLLWRFIVVTII
jgi:hypothetical protein